MFGCFKQNHYLCITRTRQASQRCSNVRVVLFLYVGESFMIQISEEKWAKLPQIDDRLTEKYGPVGSPSRKEFQAKAEAWYYAELLRDERKRQKLTQQELGERIGKKRD